MSGIAIYEGVGATLQEALQEAHVQIPGRPHRDYTISKVVEWGMQRGGIADLRLFYVKVIEDEWSPPKT